ncbi:MAG: Gfo/Idh/MocA family oxidoreductase, partial [Candidatus Latescibacteria bacterium]|nr:Gfo/Idh/MocA family oxidoreductase [Candidatus Latescibacterota bacterium]
QQERVQVIAVSDIKTDLCQKVADALAKDKPQIFSDYTEMLHEVKNIDIVTIGTGIYLHYPMLMKSLEAGCHVVMAKPSTVAVQYIDEMIAAAERNDKTVAIDFQHVYSGGTQFIKQAIMEGVLGKVDDIVVKALWRRPDDYHTRNNWSAQVMINDTYVLDGPMNNPHAHYINNALYFAGDSRYEFATPVEVQAELYHAKKIEGEDTACIRSRTDTGITIHCYSSLCSATKNEITEIHVLGDAASAVWYKDGSAEIRNLEGMVIDAAEADRGTSELVVTTLINALQGEDSRILCTLKDTRNHVLFTNGAYESSKEIFQIPEEYTTVSEVNGKPFVSLNDIEQIMQDAAEQKKLFSECGVPWARKTESFLLKDYTEFTLFCDA